MSLDGLDRLRRLQKLSKVPSKDSKHSKDDEPKLEAVAPSNENPQILLARIDDFKKGFESDGDDEYFEGDEEDSEDETKASRIPDLDLANIHDERFVGSHMYPTKSVDAAAIAAEYLVSEKMPSSIENEAEKDSETEPIKIRSVGEVLKGYRERQRADERQQQARHVRKITTLPSYNKHAPGKATGKKKNIGKKIKKVHLTTDEDKTALDYLNVKDDNVCNDEILDETGPVLLSNLNYTEFSSNYVMRMDMMAQCETILRDGRALVLRTAPYEDDLDAKMLLRTMATDLATHTLSEYCLPNVVYDAASATHEIRLDPKGGR